jgi:hypothetical protein
MPATSKRARMLEDVAGYHVQRKRARTLRMVFQLLDDLPSSDGPANTDISDLESSESSLSSLSSLSSVSSLSSGSNRSGSLGTHSRHSSINSDSSDDVDRLEDMLLDRWDARTQDLVVFLLTARVLEACPPVKKSSQLDLYLTDF